MKMKELILIPCSHKKNEGSENIDRPRYFHDSLTILLKTSLYNLRSLAKSNISYVNDIVNKTLLSAYKRYTGTIYSNITKKDWEFLRKKNDTELIILSALYGFIFWDEPIIHYNLSLVDKIDSVRFETWWSRNGLSDFLIDYIANSQITIVRSMLSGSYNRAIKDINPNLEKNIIWLDYKYTNLGSGSNFYRGEDVLRAIYCHEIQCPNKKCSSFATRRISKEEYECVECNQIYKISKLNIKRLEEKSNIEMKL